VIRVGQVAGAYGLAGAVKVIPLTDFDDRFAPGSSLLLDGAERKVQWSRPGQPGLVVKLDGIDSRVAADLFRGLYLEVPEHEKRALGEGRFYHHQVVGLAAVTSSGRPLGRITEVLERPANDVWVSQEGSVEHLIPATRDAVVEVDLADGRVIVADWLASQEDA
jgi:16S rRNA processing protein RimM